MTNFKERQASAKKVIQLQNEVLSLRQQLSKAPVTEDKPCKDCIKLKEDIDALLALNEENSSELVSEISALKADLKKLRSENTRLKNKLKDSEIEED